MIVLNLIIFIMHILINYSIFEVFYNFFPPVSDLYFPCYMSDGGLYRLCRSFY